MPVPRLRPTASISSMKIRQGAFFLPLLEHIPYARGADADEHLDEIGAADAEKGDVGLARDRLGEEGLAGAGRGRS